MSLRECPARFLASFSPWPSIRTGRWWKRKTLAKAIPAHDWRTTNVKDQDGWIANVLRREAEKMILPNLRAFLAGKYVPGDNDERMCFVGECQATNRTRALASLYVDAFAARGCGRVQ